MTEKKALNVGDVLPPLQLIEDGQFYYRDGKKYCLRPQCEGCKYEPQCHRTEMTTKIGPGVNIREAFRSRPGFLWASIDFRGIEYRVAAQESGEPVWLNAFLANRDLHTETARVMFKTDTPSKNDRDTAKCGNFCNMYLGSIETFHSFTRLSFNEAAIAWKAWWAAVPRYKQWTEKIKQDILNNGHVKTFFGRRGELKDLLARSQAAEKAGSKGGKKFGLNFVFRKGVNSIIQGGAADLLKIAMTRVTSFLEREKLEKEVKMFLTVHDELDFEIRDIPEKYEILRAIGREMTLTPQGTKLPKIPRWRVPLEVDIEVGPNWGNLTSIDELDPLTEPVNVPVLPPARDVAVLRVAGLTTENAYLVHKAIFQAANVEGVVKIPLKFQMGGHVYDLNVTSVKKVASDFLMRELERIPGIEFRYK
jgi:hypothetical protein